MASRPNGAKKMPTDDSPGNTEGPIIARRTETTCTTRSDAEKKVARNRKKRRSPLEELAKKLGLPRSTIYLCAQQRKIPCVRFGRRWVLPDGVEQRIEALAYENWSPPDEKPERHRKKESECENASVMLRTARNGDEWAAEVHRLSAAGRSVSEIAKELRLSVRVVARVRRNQLPAKSLRAAVYGATGASSTTAAKRRRTGNVWLSPRQFARRFGVGTSAVYGAVERGEVPAIRLGRHIHIPPDAVDRLLYLTI